MWHADGMLVLQPVLGELLALGIGQMHLRRLLVAVVINPAQIAMVTDGDAICICHLSKSPPGI